MGIIVYWIGNSVYVNCNNIKKRFSTSNRSLDERASRYDSLELTVRLFWCNDRSYDIYICKFYWYHKDQLGNDSTISRQSSLIWAYSYTILFQKLIFSDSSLEWKESIINLIF